MADISETIKSLLDSDAGDAIKSMVNSLSSGGGKAPDADSLASIGQLKSIAENLANNHSDPRTNLLLSLKPYMHGGRRQTIDGMVKMIGAVNIIRAMGYK